MIKESSAEGDNLIVYYHSEALNQLNDRLDVLYSFRDPLYMSKQEIERKIKYVKTDAFKFVKTQKKWMKDWQEKNILELQTELKRLSDRPVKSDFIETSKIQEALSNLYEKRYKSFKLVINEYSDFTLYVRTKKKFFTVEITYKLEPDEQDYIINDRVHKPLEGMGFKYNHRRKKYVNTFDVANFESGHLKKWLSHFMIDYCRLNGNSLQLIYE